MTVAGLDDQPVTGKKGHGPVAVDTTVDRVTADDFDALIIPGGYVPGQTAALRSRADPGARIRCRCQADRLHLPHADWSRSQRRFLKAGARPAWQRSATT